MQYFQTMQVPETPDAIAPDGSEVHILLGLAGGGMAQFTLAPAQVSLAVTHRTVEEIWLCLSGSGEMWRKQGEQEEIVALEPGVCVSIPLGTHFQFRAGAHGPFTAAGVTMPPWPGAEEAIAVEGKWALPQE